MAVGPMADWGKGQPRLALFIGHEKAPAGGAWGGAWVRL